jgi:hypothetical protein
MSDDALGLVLPRGQRDLDPPLGLADDRRRAASLVPLRAARPLLATLGAPVAHRGTVQGWGQASA